MRKHQVPTVRIFAWSRNALDGTNLLLQVLQLLLQGGVLLGHLLVLLLPLVALLLEGLDFAFEVTGLDIGLTEPILKMKKSAYRVIATMMGVELEARG